MRKLLLAAAIGLALAAPIGAPARADYVIKDGNGATQTVKSGNVSGAVLNLHTLVDTSGASIILLPGTSTSGASGLLALCATVTAAPTNVTGQNNFLSCDTAGMLRTLARLADGAGNTITSTGNALDLNLKTSSITLNVAPTVNGDIVIAPTANFTRPANTTAYASGQLVANSVTAGSVVPLSWTAARINAGNFAIRRAILFKSGTSVTNASFRLHVYTVSPTIANGDGAAWSTNRSGHVCDIDIVIINAFTDGADGIGVPNGGQECNIVAAGGSQLIYGLLEARAAYTPISAEVLTAVLEVRQN